MIDHVTIKVSDVEQSKALYERAFAALGYKIAFGEEGGFYAFAIGDGLFEIEQNEAPIETTSHVAFRVDSREKVDAFYEAALDADAKDNGAPGPRPEYTKNYYACFVLDPDGHNIEVMYDE